MKRFIRHVLYVVARQYLFYCARMVLRHHRPQVVGITGSVGKTTTKDIIAAVLMHPAARAFVGPVSKSSGNMNGNIGLPLSVLGFRHCPSTAGQLLKLFGTVPVQLVHVLRATEYPRVLVLEYGTGTELTYVAHLARMAPPSVAVVTAIGPAHLERFGTLDAIAEHKGALVREVPPSGLVVLGSDTPHSAAMDRFSAAPVVRVPGRGRLLSIDIARVVARYLGVPDDVVEHALEQGVSTKGRLETIELGTLTVINDAYNANPLSMELGLDTLSELARPGQRRVAILGDMAELGPSSPQYHRSIAAHARGRADVLIGVGQLAAYYEADTWYADSRTCAAQLASFIHAGDCVFVKGSHSVHLERVVERLRQLSTELGASSTRTVSVAVPAHEAPIRHGPRTSGSAGP